MKQGNPSQFTNGRDQSLPPAAWSKWVAKGIFWLEHEHRTTDKKGNHEIGWLHFPSRQFPSPPSVTFVFSRATNIQTSALSLSQDGLMLCSLCPSSKCAGRVVRTAGKVFFCRARLHMFHLEHQATRCGFSGENIVCLNFSCLHRQREKSRARPKAGPSNVLPSLLSSLWKTLPHPNPKSPLTPGPLLGPWNARPLRWLSVRFQTVIFVVPIVSVRTSLRTIRTREAMQLRRVWNCCRSWKISRNSKVRHRRKEKRKQERNGKNFCGFWKCMVCTELSLVWIFVLSVFRGWRDSAFVCPAFRDCEKHPSSTKCSCCASAWLRLRWRHQPRCIWGRIETWTRNYQTIPVSFSAPQGWRRVCVVVVANHSYLWCSPSESPCGCRRWWQFPPPNHSSLDGPRLWKAPLFLFENEHHRSSIQL